MSGGKPDREMGTTPSPTAPQPETVVATAAVVEPVLEDVVTPEILSAIQTEYNKRNNKETEFVDFEVKPGTVAGDNYMSIICAMKMNLKNAQSGEAETLPVMLKVMPRDESRLDIMKILNLFMREQRMYDKIIPAMERFQRETVGLAEQEICTPWPKCFASKTDGKGDYLAMEDLKAQGYTMANRQTGLDFEHSKLVLETMARFHAVSYAMFHGDFNKILECYPWLHENWMIKDDEKHKKLKDMMQGKYKEKAEIVRKAGEERGAMLLEKIYSDSSFFAELYKLIGTNIRCAVIGHGDCWTNNFLFRYDTNKKPIEVKFVDFQTSRVTWRAVDIQYFMHSSPQMAILNERENELKQIYFDEFVNFVGKLGVDVHSQMLSWENFEQEIQYLKYYGVLGGLTVAFATSSHSANVVPETKAMNKDEMKNPDSHKSSSSALPKFEKGIDKLSNLARHHLPKCQQMQKYLQ